MVIKKIISKLIENELIIIIQQQQKLKILMIGMVSLFILSLISPYLISQDPSMINLQDINQGPSEDHFFGTDYLGRDLYSRIMCGLHTSMFISTFSILFSFLIGTIVGSYSAYYGGLSDQILSRIIDIFLSFPSFVLALILISFLGAGVFEIIIILALTQWAFFARVIRGQVLYEKNQEYVMSSKIIGLPGRWIVIKHILPNCIMPAIILATMSFGDTIFALATLSFLGIGIPPSVPEWGGMINAGLPYMRTAPLNVLIPGIMITLITLLFNSLGEELHNLDSNNKKLGKYNEYA